jgi:protein gp37
MADGSAIEWTEATWNPTTGCDRVSSGCDNCYALTLAKRLKAMGAAKYQTDGDPRTSGPGFGVAIHPGALKLPYGWRQPRLVFVNSMRDLFHPGVPDEFIAEVFAVMFLASGHTFQLLTKRPGRMASLLASAKFLRLVGQAAAARAGSGTSAAVALPLPNVWLGTSIETQEWARVRMPALARTPAAVRFVSCEPLLGAVDLTQWLVDGSIDWVIVGGESGPGARPMHPKWVRELRDQCSDLETAFFFKQWGAHAPEEHGHSRGALAVVDESGAAVVATRAGGDAVRMRRVGKGKAGNVLDGKVWIEFPRVGA